MKIKMKSSNFKIIILIAFIAISVISFSAYMLFKQKDLIVISEKFKQIEYGTSYDYEEMIANIRDASIIYPDFKAIEVGNYELPFKVMNNEKRQTQIVEFKIVDTKKPIIDLYINKELVEVALNSEYDPVSNIEKIGNVDESILSNKKKLSEKEYKQLKTKIAKENQKINDRIIKSKNDLKSSDVEKNLLFYTTDLDTKQEGKYKIKVAVVDENYNISEKSWNLKVTNSSKLLNSGGSISCDYTGDDLNKSDIYTTTVVENYRYNPYKIVSYYETATSMTFTDDYNTDQNKESLVNSLREKYSSYENEKGIMLDISIGENNVTFKVAIDMTIYDKKKDVLDVLKKKDGSDIKMSTVLKESKKNKYTCK